MMRYEYDPTFVEQVVFLAASRDTSRECLTHELTDSLYRISDIELRNRKFRDAHQQLFQRFGLDRTIPAVIVEFPLVSSRLGRCIVREAERRQAQCVDLYGHTSTGLRLADEGTMVIALCPHSLLDHARLTPWMRRQLLHIEDMLDATFEYEPKLPAVDSAHRNLIRDRYAILWDSYIEGRLLRAGLLKPGNLDDLWRLFARAFTRDGIPPSRTLFEFVMSAERLTHPQMLDWAMQPESMEGIAARGKEVEYEAVSEYLA